jgi:hypothetical protein
MPKSKPTTTTSRFVTTYADLDVVALGATPASNINLMTPILSSVSFQGAASKPDLLKYCSRAASQFGGYTPVTSQNVWVGLQS